MGLKPVEKWTCEALWISTDLEKGTIVVEDGHGKSIKAGRIAIRGYVEIRAIPGRILIMPALPSCFMAVEVWGVEPYLVTVEVIDKKEIEKARETVRKLSGLLKKTSDIINELSSPGRWDMKACKEAISMLRELADKARGVAESLEKAIKA